MSLAPYRPLLSLLPLALVIACSGNARERPRSPDSCQYALDGECDEPTYCEPGTDTTDCREARLCEPQCGAQQCGTDPVCGKSCGTCGAGESCTTEGQCMPACVPDCSGRVCGADPVCGTSCGTCGGNETCDGTTGQCASPCEGGRTLCDGVCVDTSNDPTHCGGCMACPMGNLCEEGRCVEPPPDCRETPCTGFTYCDLATGQCLPGCASNDQCGVNEACDLANHTCDCIPDHVRCNGSCVIDDDIPDLGYVDDNCDGIDGHVANAIFVSPNGNDNAAGTMAAPLASIQLAIQAARSRGRPEVYIAAGVYNLTQPIQLEDYVSLYGGYDAANGWARSQNAITDIRGPMPVIFGDYVDGPLAIQGLKLTASGAMLAPGDSAYGIALRGGSGTMFIQGNHIVVQDGAAGGDGMPGETGARGDTGNNGANGREGSGGNRCGSGGRGGDSNQYIGGGVGSQVDGKPGSDGGPMGVGGMGGAGGRDCFSTRDGSDGGDGTDGAAGAPGAAPSSAMGGVTQGLYTPVPGARGDWGDSGGGGGGGGGGTYCRIEGGGGGGGGGGGCAGTGGDGGGGGGASICLFVVERSVETGQNRLEPGAGGAGGGGGDGGAGGPGGSGGNGGSGRYSSGYTSGDGGRGGDGGAGGAGGAGSGGAGGPSIGIFISEGGHSPANDQLVGAQGGAGGAGGMGAPAGPNGSTFKVYCASGTCTTVVN